MKIEIKETAEWKALNVIWKKLGTQERTELEPEFRLLSEFIRNKNKRKLNPALQPVSVGDNFGYISGLPDEIRQFVVELVAQGEPNLYHSFMAILDGKRFRNGAYDRDEILDYYFAKYRERRPYLIENREFVEAVLDYCLMRKLAKLQRSQNVKNTADMVPR